MSQILLSLGYIDIIPKGDLKEVDKTLVTKGPTNAEIADGIFHVDSCAAIGLGPTRVTPPLHVIFLFV